MHQRRIDIVSGLLRSLAIGAAGGLLFGCATTYPPAPAIAASADYNWIIGPGDSVNIVVWRNPELSMAVPVRPDGKIATPLVEEAGFRWMATDEGVLEASKSALEVHSRSCRRSSSLASSAPTANDTRPR
jgi:hypothetical protein